MTELLPCPFCGGEGQTQEVITNRDDHVGWHAHCENETCFAGYSFSIYPTEAEAIESWNTRVERTCRIGMFQTCSECGAQLDGIYGRYCPNCGAKVVD